MTKQLEMPIMIDQKITGRHPKISGFDVAEGRF
jgi:hypothetical protein